MSFYAILATGTEAKSQIFHRFPAYQDERSAIYVRVQIQLVYSSSFT